MAIAGCRVELVKLAMPIIVPLASGWDGGTSWCEASLKSNLERWGVELYLTIGSSEMVQFDFRRVTRATRYNLWFFLMFPGASWMWRCARQKLISSFRLRGTFCRCKTSICCRGVWHSCPTTRNEAVDMSGKGNEAGFLYLQLYVYIVPPLGAFQRGRRDAAPGLRDSAAAANRLCGGTAVCRVDAVGSIIPDSSEDGGGGENPTLYFGHCF